MKSLPILTPQVAFVPCAIDMATSLTVLKTLRRSKHPMRRALVSYASRRADLAYVEGVVFLSDSVTIAHAWLETPEGSVIDPYLVRMRHDAAMTTGYFGGPRWRGRELLNLLDASREADWEEPQFVPTTTLTPNVTAWLEQCVTVERHKLAVNGEPTPDPDDQWRILTALVGPWWASHLVREPVEA